MLDSRRPRFVVAGVALVILAGGVFVISYSAGSRASTFSFAAGLHYRIPADLAAGSTIEGAFREIGGRPVNFYIMTSVQYASYYGGTWAGSVFGVGEAISSSVSYSTAARDTYYFVFIHGAGINETQTVSFDWSFRSLSLPLVVAGVAFVVLAAYDLYITFRKVEKSPAERSQGTSGKEPGPPGL